MSNCIRVFAFVVCVGLVAAHGQSAPDPDINKKIRAEENDHSQIMETMHFFTDVYGPRLTGSPNHKAAADWAIRRMKEWGLENGHLEPWDFGHPGWANERSSGYIVAPIHDQLTFKVLAWTPGTNGAITAPVMQMVLPEKPKKEDLAAYLDALKGKVKGKIVMVGKAEVVPVVIDVPPRRLDDKLAAERFDPKNPNAGQFGPQRNAQQPQPDAPGTLTPQQINQQIDEFLLAYGALLRVNDARMGNGRIRAFNNRTFDITKVVPTVVLRNEDYGRIARIMADGSKVELEFNIQNRIYPEGKTSYNTIAEIPGTDRKDEVVMLGGHLDSWHSATGATDNAIGCAIMMEAARILKTLGVKPRRTIRVALWSGEEEGLLGSQAYVKEHFGSFEEPKPEFSKLVAYFNVDSGTGRIRGASVFGPPQDADILREVLLPFADLGVTGAISSKSRRAGGTDSSSFAQAGLPGVGLGQDPIEYFTDTWHTNIDTYERIIEDDVKKDAIMVAAAVYQLAMREEMIPRFTAAEMPPKPEPPGTPGAQPAVQAGGTPAGGATKPANGGAAAKPATGGAEGSGKSPGTAPRD
ncbi:MAG TPA: M20/M25/M40 family metallo-hydrolase [Terriglobales bacterium]|nr:M20/M25/M40 family metallo-hydrolase [Terriglobales bacterium]